MSLVKNQPMPIRSNKVQSSRSAERILRDAAYVLELTRRVRTEILRDVLLERESNPYPAKEGESAGQAFQLAEVATQHAACPSPGADWSLQVAG